MKFTNSCIFNMRINALILQRKAHMQLLQTPTQLALAPSQMPISVPEYDFDSDSRWDGTILAEAYTGNSIQTFDNSGKPSDARSDNTD